MTAIIFYNVRPLSLVNFDRFERKKLQHCHFTLHSPRHRKRNLKESTLLSGLPALFRLPESLEYLLMGRNLALSNRMLKMQLKNQEQFLIMLRPNLCIFHILSPQFTYLPYTFFMHSNPCTSFKQPLISVTIYNNSQKQREQCAIITTVISRTMPTTYESIA